MKTTTPPPTAIEHLSHANSFLARGQAQTAITHYQQALILDPQLFIAWNNLGTALLILGQLKKARNAYLNSLSLNPSYPDSLYSLGLIANSQGKLNEAVHYFRLALKSDPLHLKSWQGLGQSLRDLGQPAKAIKALKDAINHFPSHFDLHYLLGNTYRDLDNNQEAKRYYKIATKLNPTHARAWGDLATVDIFLNHPDLALKSLDTAIMLDPTLPHLYFNQGMAYKAQGNLQKTIDSFNHVLRLDPEYVPAIQGLYFLKREICDWRGIDSLEQVLDSKHLDNHYTSLLRSDSLAKNFAIAKLRSQDLQKIIPSHTFTFPKHPKVNQKIRLGYVSRDFRNHPVGQMVTPIFTHHDRNKFEVFVFAAGPNDHSEWHKLAEQAQNYFDLGTANHQLTAEAIHKAKVDILIDATGPMTHNPMVASALRPAPIQVSWMGVLGTSGASYYDYVIGDPVVTPFSEAPYYSEQIVQLPCFSWFNTPPISSTTGFNRQYFGLPTNQFVFASFGLPQKIDADIWHAWMYILKHVPRSVLWLWGRHKEVSLHLRDFAKKEGVDPKRLIFFDKLPLAKHLTRIQFADLVLDTHVYQGGQTSSSILGTGTPLLTTLGHHFIGRVSASILYKMGVPELVTKNLKDYIDKAITLANNAQLLAEIRHKLIHTGLGQNLYPPAKFVIDLEHAYQCMWQNYLHGLPPRPIVIPRAKDVK